jgi:hypothetical protein
VLGAGEPGGVGGVGFDEGGDVLRHLSFGP